MPVPNQAVLDYLSTRLSYPAKVMTGPAPSRDAVMAILATATRVPDHGKLEPWRLIVVEKPAMARLAALAEDIARAKGSDAERIDKGRGQFDRGHLAVVVVASPKPSEKIPPAEQVLSAGALCMNIVHAATAAGWGANWLTGWVSHDRDFIARAFGCTDAETVAGIIHIATPAAPLPDRPRPDLSRIVTWAE